MGCICSKMGSSQGTPPTYSIEEKNENQLIDEATFRENRSIVNPAFRCPNEWCRLHAQSTSEMSRSEVILHQKRCAEKKPVRCFLCGDVFKLGELEIHTDECIIYQHCIKCEEVVIRRLVKYCPLSLPSALTNTNKKVMSIDEYVLEVARPFEDDPIAYPCVILQTYISAVRFRHRIIDMLFCLFWKEIRISRQSHIFSAQYQTGSISAKSPVEGSFDLDRSPTYKKPSERDIDPFLNCPYNRREFFTIELIRKMIDHFQSGHRLPYETAWRIVEEAIQYLEALPNIPHVDIKQGTHGHQQGNTETWAVGAKVIVVGDIHGQLHDLLHILLEVGLPNYYQGRIFIFNGDFVDRGSNSMEVILLLYAMMLACPCAVFLNRGNHEVFYMNEDYGFDMEVITKYDKELYFLLQRSFDALPLGTCVDGKVLVLHGGVPRFPNTSIKFINSVFRFRPMPIPLQQANNKDSSFLNPLEPKEDIVFQDILWSDPCERNGVYRNDRGAGNLFGPDASENFMSHNNIELIFRSHEPFLCGYEKHHNKRVITVFSASDYDGDGTNLGSYAVLSAANVTQPIFHTYRIRNQKDKKHTKPHALHSLAGGYRLKFPQFHEAHTRHSTKLQQHGTNSVENVLRYIRQQIYSKKHTLVKLFNAMDQTNKGTVWKVEWVEAMSTVMELEKLPWFFLRSYFAEEDEDCRINYTHFLLRYQNELILSMRKELGEVIPTKFATAVRENKRAEKLFFDLISGKYQNILRAKQRENPVNATVVNIISYSEFEMIINILDIGLSDEEIFHLFNFFDVNYEGFLSTNRVAEYLKDGQSSIDYEWSYIQTSPNKLSRSESSPLQLRLLNTRLDPQPSILELEIMQELQHLFLSGKVGIEKAFLFMVSCEESQPCIHLEDFTKGIKALTSTLSTPLSVEQIENLYHLIDVDQDGVISFQDFNDSFAVHDVLSEIRALDERL